MSRYKLYTLITCIVGLLIIIGSYFITQVVSQKIDGHLIENYEEQEKILAVNISRSLLAEVEFAKRQLLLLSQNEIIRNGTASACSEEIKKVIANANLKIGNIGRVDKKGMFQCSLNAALVGTQASNLGTYISDIFEDPEHKLVMSKAIRVPGADSYLVAIHIPVFDNEGNFDGTLGAAIYLSDIQVKYLKNVNFSGAGSVVLIDQDGTVLYHKFNELIGSNVKSELFKEIVGGQEFHDNLLKNSLLEQGGSGRYVTVREGEKIASYEPILVAPGRVWIIVVTIPISDARHDISKLGISALLLNIWLLVTLVIVCAQLATIYLNSKFVFKPINQIQEMKSDFVSLVSHQLKTPVAQIKGYIENIRDGLTGPITEKQKEYLNDMLHVANSNSKLIDDLLNVSRIERGMLKVEKERINLSTLMEEVLEPLRLVAPKKKVQLIEQLTPSILTVVGDPVKTKEAIRNLVDNAIKFTGEGHAVTITTSEEAQYAIISVADEGPGIDPSAQTELFSKNRVWFGKVKASGAGLGLFLAKQFIELTGGKLTFVTVQGKGTTFVVNLLKT